MWRPDQNRNRISSWITCSIVVFVAIIISALGAFVWEQAGISYLDRYLQVAFVGSFCLAIAVVANYVISRRW